MHLFGEPPLTVAFRITWLTFAMHSTLRPPMTFATRGEVFERFPDTTRRAQLFLNAIFHPKFHRSLLCITYLCNSQSVCFA